MWEGFQLIHFVFAAKQKFHELPLASLPILVIPVLSGQEQDGVEHFFAFKEDDVTIPENII